MARNAVASLSALVLLMAIAVRFRTAFGLCWLGPRVHCDDVAFDFGSAAIGDEIHHDFIIANTGWMPLHIVDIQADCGCTAAIAENEVVPPGDNVAIHATLSLEKARGKTTRLMLVKTDSSCGPNLTLAMNGTVTSELEAMPAEVRLRPGVQATLEIGSVDAAKPLAIAEVTGVPSDVSVEWNPVDNTAGRYKVTIAPKGPSAAASFATSRSFRLEFATDHAKEKIISVLVHRCQ